MKNMQLATSGSGKVRSMEKVNDFDPTIFGKIGCDMVFV
jgi:hypothetical protein